MVEIKGMLVLQPGLLKQQLPRYALRAARENDAVRLSRNLGGQEDIGLQARLVDEGHRRAGRDAPRRVAGVVEGVGSSVLRNRHAHVGFRVEDDGAFLHDDEIVVIGVAAGIQVQVDVERMILIKPLVLKHKALFGGGRTDGQAKTEGEHKHKQQREKPSMHRHRFSPARACTRPLRVLPYVGFGSRERANLPCALSGRAVAETETFPAGARTGRKRVRRYSACGSSVENAIPYSRVRAKSSSASVCSE